MPQEPLPPTPAKFDGKRFSNLPDCQRQMLAWAFGDSQIYDQMRQMAYEDDYQNPSLFRRPLSLLAGYFRVDMTYIKRRLKTMVEAELITQLTSRGGRGGSAYLLHDVEAWAARYPERLDGRYRTLSVPGRSRTRNIDSCDHIRQENIDSCDHIPQGNIDSCDHIPVAAAGAPENKLGARDHIPKKNMGTTVPLERTLAPLLNPDFAVQHGENRQTDIDLVKDIKTKTKACVPDHDPQTADSDQKEFAQRDITPEGETTDRRDRTMTVAMRDLPEDGDDIIDLAGSQRRQMDNPPEAAPRTDSPMSFVWQCDPNSASTAVMADELLAYLKAVRESPHMAPGPPTEALLSILGSLGSEEPRELLTAPLGALWGARVRELGLAWNNPAAYRVILPDQPKGLVAGFSKHHRPLRPSYILGLIEDGERGWPRALSASMDSPALEAIFDQSTKSQALVSRMIFAVEFIRFLSLDPHEAGRTRHCMDEGQYQLTNRRSLTSIEACANRLREHEENGVKALLKVKKFRAYLEERATQPPYVTSEEGEQLRSARTYDVFAQEDRWYVLTENAPDGRGLRLSVAKTMLGTGYQISAGKVRLYVCDGGGMIDTIVKGQGRTLTVTEAQWKALRPSLIPDDRLVELYPMKWPELDGWLTQLLQKRMAQ